MLELGDKGHKWHVYLQGKPKHSEKIWPNAILSATNPKWTDVRLKSGRHGKKTTAWRPNFISEQGFSNSVISRPPKTLHKFKRHPHDVRWQFRSQYLHSLSTPTVSYKMFLWFQETSQNISPAGDTFPEAPILNFIGLPELSLDTIGFQMSQYLASPTGSRPTV
jgi:hypothetical protein